jgi:hypothetical protein
MRIIETLLPKGKPDSCFTPKTAFVQRGALQFARSNVLAELPTARRGDASSSSYCHRLIVILSSSCNRLIVRPYDLASRLDPGVSRDVAPLLTGLADLPHFYRISIANRRLVAARGVSGFRRPRPPRPPPSKPDRLVREASVIRRILLHLPIDSVMSFLSTTGCVVPVDSRPERG